MKGNEKVIQKLDELLADELTAIMQYVVHSEMCANWGYDRLHDAVEKRAVSEMRHAEALIARILFLEGKPTVTRLNAVRIGQTVEEQLKADLDAEHDAVRRYNEGVRLADELCDTVTRHLLEDIAKQEDEHVDWIEAQLDQIAHMGLPMYLSMQTGK